MQKQTLPFPTPVLPGHADNKCIPAQTTFSIPLFLLPSLHLRDVFLAIWKRNGKKGDAKHRNKLSLFSAVDGTVGGKKMLGVINPYIPTPNYTPLPKGHGIMVNKYRCSSY